MYYYWICLMLSILSIIPLCCCTSICCFCFLFKCYCGWFVLVLWSSTEFLHSRGGGTQGDPVSMFMYAIKTLPLIAIIRHCLAYSEKLWREDSLANLLFSSIW